MKIFLQSSMGNRQGTQHTDTHQVQYDEVKDAHRNAEQNFTVDVSNIYFMNQVDDNTDNKNWAGTSGGT